jgi:hypothetical protein
MAEKLIRPTVLHRDSFIGGNPTTKEEVVHHVHIHNVSEPKEIKVEPSTEQQISYNKLVEKYEENRQKSH